METINIVENITNSYGTINEIIEFNGKKFKLQAQLRNGGNALKAELMDSDGVFQFVLGLSDVNFTYTASYVSRIEAKKVELNLALKQLKKVITIIYG